MMVFAVWTDSLQNKASRKPLASKVELEDSGDNGTKTNADIARNEAVSTPTFDIQHSPLSRSNIYDGPNKSPSTVRYCPSSSCLSLIISVA